MTSPIYSANGTFEITPSDDTDLDNFTTALRCATAGNLVVVCADGAAMTLRFTAGETRYVRVKRVKATSTTATGIEGMY